MSNKELKPCPFCGKKDSVQWDDHNGIYYILCNAMKGGCGSTSGGYENKCETIELWNTRHSPWIGIAGDGSNLPEIGSYDIIHDGVRKVDCILHSGNQDLESHWYDFHKKERIPLEEVTYYMVTPELPEEK